MREKTPPLTYLSITNRVEFLAMLNTLDLGVDKVERAKNAQGRTQAIADLRVMIEEVKKGHELMTDIAFILTHERGRTAAAGRGGKAKADKSNTFPEAIIPYLERDWDSLPEEGRPKRKDWLKVNLDRLLQKCGYAHFIGEADETSQVIRWLNPKQRPKSFRPKL